MNAKTPVVVLAGLVLGLIVLGWQRDRTQAAPGEAGKIDKKERTLTVTGAAKVRFSPDSARLFFGVESTAPTVAEARKRTTEKVSKVLAALGKLNIDGLKTKTSSVRVDAVHERRREGNLEKTVQVGYQVAINFTVLIQNADTDKLSASASRVLDTGLEHGANAVQAISFFKEKWRPHQREAMTKAVEDALLNAQAMAAGAKVSLVSTTTIDGVPNLGGGWSNNIGLQNVQSSFNARMPAGDGEPTPIVAGDLEISYTVTIVCSY